MFQPGASQGAFCSAASAAALELHPLLQVIAEFTCSDLGRSRILALEPTADQGELSRRQSRLREVWRASALGSLLPALEGELAPLLLRLERPGRFTGVELLRLEQMLLAVTTALERFAAAPEDYPELSATARATLDGEVEALRLRIASTLDARGQVRDDASPRLGSLRSLVRRHREALYESLNRYLKEHEDVLGEETISLRDGRLTVLLPAGSRGRLAGLTHGRSATRRSFYFEPLDTVEANNDLQQAVEDEAAERERLLGELVSDALSKREALLAYAAVYAELDALVAAHRFGERCRARLPELGGAGELRLVKARHPLLDPALARERQAALGQAGNAAEVVPLDLDFADHRVLVVTGPNAGGKTVALKTLGLLVLLHQCGLPIPSSTGTRLPLLRRVVAMIGDEQSVLEDRSTFSARLLRLKEAWEAAAPDTLVLLDELGSGTNPEEGAALAVALLEGLLERGATALLVTHLTQLAAAALSARGAGCAAMEFDPHSHRPTFRLCPGPPGGSEALALAERLQLPSAWLRRAEELLGHEHRDLRRLLREVEDTRQALLEERALLEQRLRDQELLDRRLEEELRRLTDERRQLKKKLTAELELFRREVRARLESEIAELKQSRVASPRQAAVGNVVERLFEQVPESLAEEASPEQGVPGEVAVGDLVEHRGLGWQGALEQLGRGRGTVRVKGKRVRCLQAELVRVSRPKSSPSSSASAPSAARRIAVSVASGEDVHPELNLIGQRVEPALEAVDRYLDRALLGHASRLRVIHGHGSGRLRRALREHLKSHPAVATVLPAGEGEGGEGATVVLLKDGG